MLTILPHKSVQLVNLVYDNDKAIQLSIVLPTYCSESSGQFAYLSMLASQIGLAK